MQAVLVRENTPFENVQICEVPDPLPAPGEVVVDVAVAEVNYPDLMVIEGSYQIKPPFPFSPGKSAAGRVSAVGEGVTGLHAGDRVAVQVEYGTYAEKVRVPAASCYPIPDDISFEKAAALGLVYQTAWFALRERASFVEGENVLVLGASGGVGMAGVQLARALGAKKVIGGVLGERNVAVALQAGAHHVIDLGAPDLRDTLRQHIAEYTDGHGCDVLLDPVGGDAAAAAMRAMAWCGRVVVIGFASGTVPQFKANYLLVKNISVGGLQWSDYRERQPHKVARAQQEIFGLCSRGLVDPVISQTYPLGGFKLALQALREGKAQGKMLLKVA
jgi:NADPH:quinone reductase